MLIAICCPVHIYMSYNSVYLLSLDTVHQMQAYVALALFKPVMIAKNCNRYTCTHVQLI